MEFPDVIILVKEKEKRLPKKGGFFVGYEGNYVAQAFDDYRHGDGERLYYYLSTDYYSSDEEAQKYRCCDQRAIRKIEETMIEVDE